MCVCVWGGGGRGAVGGRREARLPPRGNDDGVFADGVVEIEIRHLSSVLRPPHWVFPASHVAKGVHTLNVRVV